MLEIGHFNLANAGGKNCLYKRPGLMENILVIYAIGAMEKKPSLSILLFLALVILLADKGYPQHPASKTEASDFQYTSPPGRVYDYRNLLVTRVIDPENIQLSDGRRVKLIGVEPLNPVSASSYQDLRASQYLQFLKRLLEGQRINIELDSQQYDVNSRILGYVYLTDGTFVNAEVLRQGYGQPNIVYPNAKYRDLFLTLYTQSRDNKRGLWR